MSNPRFAVGDRVVWNGPATADGRRQAGEVCVVTSRSLCGTYVRVDGEDMGHWDARYSAAPAAPTPDDAALAWLKRVLSEGYPAFQSDYNDGHRMALMSMLEQVYGLRAVSVPASTTFVAA